MANIVGVLHGGGIENVDSFGGGFRGVVAASSIDARFRTFALLALLFGGGAGIRAAFPNVFLLFLV